MKVLFVHKFYGKSGGPETCIYGLERRLKEEGHATIPFSMKGEFNLNSPYYEYFVDNVDYGAGKGRSGLFRKFKNAVNIIYSFEAAKKIEQLIKKEKPDIVHIHNSYHQISPSIFSVIKKYGIPIFMTLHDYKLICPNYRLYTSGEVCEKCKNGKYYNAFAKRCTKNSASASFLNCVEAFIHRLTGVYTKNVDQFISPSEFLTKKMIEHGMPENRLVTIPNGIEIGKYEPVYKFLNYFLYFGRIDKEKGIRVLLDAAKHIKNIQVLLAGSGSEEEQLRKIVKKEKIDNVKFLGFINGVELKGVVQNAMFTVAPSLWYENCSISILESMAYGKPVIGSRIGGIPEQISDGVNGLLFEPGNSKDLAEKIMYLASKPELIIEMGRNARRTVEEKYSMDMHYKKMINLYNKLLKNVPKKGAN